MSERDGDGRAFGAGKVILLGEHAVVYGVPALAAGLGRGVHASAHVVPGAEETTLTIVPWDVTVRLDGEDDLSRALRALVEAHPLSPLPALRIEAEVALPAGAGLGCSAALGVAVLRAIDRAVGLADPPDDEVASRSLAWERVFHGNPSGIDNTMAAHGGVACFRKGAPLEVVRARQPLVLVIGDSGESASTKRMVESVARQRMRDPKRFEQTLEAVKTLVDNARLALTAGDSYGLGQLMNLNQALLSSLMLSTNSLEEMCAAARDAGAQGAKLTGSGGGGCMIALVGPDGDAARITRAIEATGHRAFVAEAGR